MTEYYNAPYLEESEHAVLNHTGIPGVGGGSGFTLQNEWARWSRTGTGFIDYVVDQTETDPNGVITVDTSIDWLNIYGSPVPKVSETGIYQLASAITVFGGPQISGDWVEIGIGFAFEESDGNFKPWVFPNNPSWATQTSSVFPVTTNPTAHFETVALVDSGTHVDFTRYDISGVVNGAPVDLGTVQSWLMIRRIG